MKSQIGIYNYKIVGDIVKKQLRNKSNNGVYTLHLGGMHKEGLEYLTKKRKLNVKKDILGYYTFTKQKTK